MNVKLLSVFSLVLLPMMIPGIAYAEISEPPASLNVSQNGTKPKRSAAMEEMLLFFDESDLIVTATKHPLRLQDAPAIATVISGEEIRNMGARNILDVLRTVPGFGITQGYFGLKEIEVRGIKSVYSEKVKLLIDGHSVNNNVYGFATWSFDDLIVDNVKRIEIIRGPGSALYGSNAFSAVINVVTKDGKDVDGAILTGGGGSFNTGKFGLQAGKRAGDLDTIFTFDYMKTDGARLHIDSDVIGRSGETSDFQDKIDAGLKLAYKDWAFNSRYVAKRRGPYIGVTYALSDDSEARVFQFFGEISNKHTISEDAKIITKAYIDEHHIDAYWKLFPDGTTLPYYGTFANGMIANPRAVERIVGVELQADLQISDNNFLTAGALYENRNQTSVSMSTNYNPNPALCTGHPAQFDLQEVGSWCNFSKETDREIWAAYVQDQVNVNKDVNFILGARHDHYSDFGETTNPRAAIVWKLSDRWDAKLLYGRAFRAPSFAELYYINNPSTLGNPQLKPEKMETYEVSVGYTVSSDYRARISGFNNLFRDKIQLVTQSDGSSKFQNTGGANVQGVELEVRKDFGKDSYTYLNYTYQLPKDDDTGLILSDAPAHKGNLGGNIGVSRYLNANLNLFVSGERPRAAGDARSDSPAYAVVDLTLIAKNFFKGLEIRGSAHNILDQRYVDPAPTVVQGDFPRDGASFIVDALYRF